MISQSASAMVCDGMVAVVRGLQDAGLAVTFLDGTHQYTLMPNNGLVTESQLSRNMGVACQMANVHVGTESNTVRCESGAQACDGRYTTVYRASHCNATPTSPAPMLTEFPPQKPTVCRGHGNFEVGGSGSGDKDYTPIKASGNYRGGMCWPDRGSVCTPRPSHEPDAFANSLRKYPSMSPDRSTEIVERLISYTQGRNSLRQQSRSIGSPTRTVDSNMSTQNMDRFSRNTISRSLQKNIYEPEVTLRVRKLDESPTRDRSRTRREESGKSVYGRSYDVRYVRDGPKRDRTRNPGFYPYTQPACPSIRDKYVGTITETGNTAVNMEIQAAVPMVSREVATTPGVEPIKRTVAVPLSPITSVSCNPEGGVFQACNVDTTFNSNTTSKNVLTYPKSVQVTASSVEFFNFHNKKRLFDRKSKSHEDVRMSATRDVVQLFKSLKPNNKNDKIILKGLDRVLDKVGSINKGDKVQIKVGSVNKYTNSYSNKHNRRAGNEPSTSRQMNRKRGSNIFRAELNTTKGFEKSNEINSIIKDWATNLNIKNRDFLNRNIDREEIVNTLVSRLKVIVFNRSKGDKIRGEVMEVVEDVPFNINGEDKRAYISNIVDSLLTKINNIPFTEYPELKLAGDNDLINTSDRKESTSKIKKDIQPTEEELKEFIVTELMDFLDKHNLKINFNVFDEVEIELVDILLDSIEAIRKGENIYVKEEIVSLVLEVSWFSASQSKCFADTLLAHLCDMLRGSSVKEVKSKSQTVLVMQNSCQNSLWNQNTTDFSIGAISEADIDSNLDYYMNQLTQQIDEWLSNLSLTCCTDKGFRQVVVNDLAADIVDRHKYIEKNPENRGSCKDELEHLRYEIYKWINKLVGEDNTSTLEHAPELMQRIRSIPVPMLTMPDIPECCQPPGRGKANQSASNFANNSRMSSTKIGDISQGSLKNKTPCQKCCGSRDEKSKTGQAGSANQSQKRPTGTSSRTKVPDSCCSDDGQRPMFGPSGPGGSLMQPQRPLTVNNRRKSHPGGAPGPMAPSGTCPGAGNMSQIPMSGQRGFGPGSMGSNGTCPTAGNSMGSSGFDSGSIHHSGTCSGGVSQMPKIGPPGLAGNMMEQQGMARPNKRFSGPPGFASGPMMSSGAYLGQPGSNITPGDCTGTRQPGTCCPDENEMPMFGPSGPGGSMMEQRGMARPNKRFSGPAGFASGPMVSSGAYPGQPGGKIGPGAYTGTRQPATCCSDESEMPMFGPTGPGGSMMEQSCQKAPNRRLSSPGRFASAPVAPSSPYSSGINAASHMGGFQSALGSQGGISKGMYGGTCCNETSLSQGKVSGGRNAQGSTPTCCQGKSPQQFSGEPNMMNQNGGCIQNSQMNSSQMSNMGPPGPGGGMQGPCAPKPEKRKLTMPSDFAVGTGTCPANISLPQTFGQMNQSMFSGEAGSGYGAQAPPSSCCGGIQSGQISMFGPQGAGGSMMQPREPFPSDRRYSSPGALPTGYMHEICPREAQGQEFIPTPCCPGMQVTPTMPSVVQLNEEYDEFVKTWVKEIPIPACSPEEVAFAEKARLGIYNGIWKSLTKLKCNPATFHNKFYYEDVFDDDIEELLGLLPPNPELETKKHLLKVTLIEKTTTTNEILKSIIAPSMYRQQLVDNVVNNLPKRAVTDVRSEDPIRLYEELKILNIAEDFILFARYKDDDKVKANIYKKKLLKKAEELVEEVKRTHGQELKDIDPGMYINDILSALHKVPVPGEDTVREEADEILLGLEIEQWFSDLPLVENDNHAEQLNRRRLRDALAKKIHEMEKVVNLADCSADRELKHEVSKFLEKLPLQRDQDLNINFMVDELTNRMKNRTRESAPDTGTSKKKSVAFEVPLDYDDFSRNMQCCSSFSDLPNEFPAEFNQSSLSMQNPMDQYGGGAFQNECCKGGQQAARSMNQGRSNGSSLQNVQGSQQWHTLNEIQASSVCPPRRSSISPHSQTNQNQWHTLNDSQPHCQICPSPKQSNVTPYNQTYQGQSQMGQSGCAHQSFPSQANSAQQRRASQMGQSNLLQQSCPSQMGQAGSAQQSYNSQMGQSTLAQQSCPSQIGQAYSAQHRRPSQMGKSNFAQQPCPSQMGPAGSAQQSCHSQMGQSNLAQQSYPNQVGQSSQMQPSCPNQMGQSAFAQMQCPSKITQQSYPSQTGQASLAQQRRLSQMGQASLAQQQCSTQMGQSSSAQQSYQSQMGQISCEQQSNQRRMGFTQPSERIGTASFTQQHSQSKMGHRSFSEQSAQNHTGRGNFNQQQGCGSCQHSEQVNSQSQPYQMGPEMGHAGMSQRPFQAPDEFQQQNYSQEPQEVEQQRNCQSCSHGSKSSVPSQRTSQHENKTNASSHNVSKYSAPKDQPQSPKPPSTRHSRCFEELPQLNQKTGGRSNQSQRSKSPFDQSNGKRPRTPNKTSNQAVNPSDQSCCGSSVPGALAAKSLSNASPLQDSSSPTSEYVQGFRAGQKQGRLSNGSPFGQPVGYSTPRDGLGERRRPCDGGRPREQGGIEIEDMEEEVETERDETRCRCMERMFRCRRKRPTCFQYEKFENDCPIDPSVPVNKLIRSGHQKDDRKRIRKESEERKHLDIVASVISSSDLKKCYKCSKVRKSRSQELSAKLIDIDMHDDVLEWYQMHSNTMKVKMWGEKLQRIADKLQNSHEQDKLKAKIEKYLKRVPSQFSECDEDRREFRKQLPDQLIRKLRKFYNKSNHMDPLNIYHVEMPNYYSMIQTNQDELRNVLRSWLKTIYFKRRDFLGRPIRKDDVIDFIEYKLQPFITNQSNSEQEYKYILKSKIIEAVNELPVATSGDCLNRRADKLIEDILKIANIPFDGKGEPEKTFKGKSIRPAIKEIKDFITDQILEFLDQNNIELRASKIFRLEMDLTDILTNVLDTSVLHDSVKVKSRVCEVMRNIGKLTMIRAVDFTDTLLNNFKKTYNAVTNNNPTSFLPTEYYSVYVQNRSSKSKHHSADLSIGDAKRSDHTMKSVNNYNKQLANQVNEWLKDIQIPKQKKASKDTAVKQLAADIVDRHKYLEFNPNSKGTETEELEHLKFQIFKWINNLVGEDNKTTLERAPDLMKRIQSVPVPVLTKPRRSQAYIDHLTDSIFEWYHDLPIDLHSSEDETTRNQNVKSLAENIEKAVKSKKSVNEAINKEVNVWTKKVFRIQPKSSATDQLKAKLKAVIFKDESNLSKDPKQEKLYIRRYEDVIDDWIDTFPLEPKREASFSNTRNEHIHELAVKLHNSRTKLVSVPPDVLSKKLQDEVSDWLKKLPLHQQTNKKSFRDQFASRLIRNILECNLEESLEMSEKMDDQQFADNQIEGALVDWLKTLPLYREKSITEKQKQEKIMLQLANKLNGAMQKHSECDPDLEIEKHIQMLDIKFKNDEDFVHKTALQLKLHLQKLNMFADMSQRDDINEDEFLEANIEAWIRNLPVNVPSDVERSELEVKQKVFTKTMKELRANKANEEVLIAEIVNFMKTLPLSRTEDFFLNEEADKLIKSMYVVPIGNVSRKGPPTSSEIISDAISNWSVLLPLKPIHCPTELRSLIDQMTREITNIIVSPDHSVGGSNEELIKQTIQVYLRKFPIKPERQDDQQLNKMGLALYNDLKDMQLLRNDYNRDVEDKPLYDQHPYDGDKLVFSRQDYTENENIGLHLDEYLRRLTIEIDEWLNTLQGHIPEIHDKCFREIVVNDLAGDIVDRHKYLELNPTVRGTDEDELEHLKYQIFKWINKLVGEDNLVTIDHASELMSRIRNISTLMRASAAAMRESTTIKGAPVTGPAPRNMIREHATDHTKLPTYPPQDQAQAHADVNMHNAEAQAYVGPRMEHAQSMTLRRSSKNEPRERVSQTETYRGISIHADSPSQTLAYVSEGVDATLTPRDIQAGPTIGSDIFDSGTMLFSQENMTSKDKEVNRPELNNASKTLVPPNVEGSALEAPQFKSSPTAPQFSIPRKSGDYENMPEGMTINEVHKYYDDIIRDLCAQLPFKVDNPEQERMAELARKGVHNTIWKTYFKFKSDPELENDYIYVEFLLEETIDDCLDIITNPELENIRQGWKGKVILQVMNMMKCVHSISDSPSFREQLGSKMDRIFTKDRFDDMEYQISQGFISRIADSYILYANYKNDDPVKANIYRHRLMKRLELFVQEQTKQHNKEFRKLDNAKMCQKAFKILESVPLPTNDVLKDEADEVLLNEEIDNWYHDLPVKPLESQYDEQFRRRMLEVLAKKIREMEKRSDFDEPSMQRELKHEMSVFLKRRARLQQDEDLNINFMVDELTNRLKNRKNREIDYESFQKDVPLCSTFEQIEPVEALAPLVHVQSIQQQSHVCGPGCRRASQGHSFLSTSQTAGQSNQYMSEQPMMQKIHQHSSFSKPPPEQTPFSCTASGAMTQSTGLLGTSQMPGTIGTIQQYPPNQGGFISTHTPCVQSQPSMLQSNRIHSEYVFSQSNMPQMAPYPGPMPPDVSGYPIKSNPSLVVPNVQSPGQYTRSSLPRQTPSNGYLGTEMPGFRPTTSTARIGEVIGSRVAPEANVQMDEEEIKNRERIESRCRCVEYCRRRRRRVCFPYNDNRRRCFPSYPMPMPFPFNCFY